MITLARAAAAFDAVRPGVPRSKRQMMLGQVRAESDFGNAFKTPDGSDSNNWGAIYAKGDRGTIPVQDTYEGKPITMGAAWNSTPEVGARQFTNLIQGSYPQAWAAADGGNAWDYALGLWRKGPGTSYFTGFPPGHKWSLAPKGTKSGSALDHYYRILAYAKFVAGGAASVARALGEPVAVRLVAPPPPKGSKVAGSRGGDGLGLAVMLGGGIFAVTRLMDR